MILHHFLQELLGRKKADNTQKSVKIKLNPLSIEMHFSEELVEGSVFSRVKNTFSGQLEPLPVQNYGRVLNYYQDKDPYKNEEPKDVTVFLQRLQINKICGGIKCVFSNAIEENGKKLPYDFKDMYNEFVKNCPKNQKEMIIDLSEKVDAYDLFKQAYYKQYKSEFFKNPFSKMLHKIPKLDRMDKDAAMQEVIKYAEQHPKSRTAKILTKYAVCFNQLQEQNKLQVDEQKEHRLDQ